MEDNVEQEPAKTGPLGKIKNALSKLDTKQKVILAVGILALVGMLGITFSGMKGDEWKVLFSNVSEKDGGAIMSALEKENIPNKVNNNGSILVPADKVNQLRLKLAAQGLPRGGSVGFELLDNQKFGLSSFAEQVNYHRGLEGELARTIQSIASIQSARVHLAIPQKTVFMRETKEATASVMLTLYPGRSLDSLQISGISNLVASSVPELNVNNVSITDQNGNLLSKGNRNGTALAHDYDNFKYTKNIEQNIVQHINDILTPLLGKENYTVQVNAEIDFSVQEQTEERYSPNNTPDKMAIRNQQTAETASAGGGSAGGVPGALSNQPPVPATAPMLSQGNGGGKPNSAGNQGRLDSAGITTPLSNMGQPVTATKNSTISYEVDKTIKHTKSAVGDIKKLSAGIVINYRKEVDKNGKSEMKAIPAEELKRIEDSVKTAMGFSETRGDMISVINAPFATQVEKDDSLPLWKDPQNIDYAKEILKTLLMLGIALFIWTKMIKPIIKVMTEDKEKDKSNERGGNMNGGNLGMATSNSDIEEVLGSEEYSAILEKAKSIAVTDPNSVSHIVKEWMDKNGSRPS